MNEETKILWIDFLKGLTRSLVQVNLYKSDHPQVMEALDQTLAALAPLASSGEINLTLDNGKLLADGAEFLPADKVPNSIKNVFARFQAQTVTFRASVTREELLAFCGSQAVKTDPYEYLKEKGVSGIAPAKSVYAKVEAAGDKAAIKPGAQAPGSDGGTGGTAASPGAPAAEELEPADFPRSLSLIAARLTPDAAEQKRIVDALMKKFLQEVDERVNKALEEVKKEKRKIENDISRTEAVVSSIAEGVVVVDAEGKILMMNPQAEALSGKRLGELSGKKLLDVAALENQVLSLASEIRPESQKELDKGVATAGDKGLAETIKKATAIVQNEDGRIVGAVSIPTDAARLKEIDKLQSDFVANMTHELRSPLTSIKAALDMLRKDGTVPESQTVLNTAIRNAERLNSIITDILDFSKLQSGKLVFRQARSAPAEIAREASESMKAWAQSKGITLDLRTEPELPAVYADPNRTTQVLINLLSNAIKFTPNRGRIEISVDAGKEALSNYVFFSVKDSGPGIKKEDQEKIFEKFVQVASGEKVGGTGLGLAITKAMTVMQGGRLTLDSEPGKGSTFRVGMPVYRGQGEAQETSEVPAAPRPAKPWWRKLLGI
ncbi:MAG: ATP-binding protein [Elusimicrobiales bacterium]|nr:ATP-binding protein [Elusimicrobiales bacterium]